VYSVIGPTKGFISGNLVPGGEQYLRLNLEGLARLHPTEKFQVYLAHSILHGKLNQTWSDIPRNMQIEIVEFGESDITDFSSNPVLQHGQLLNEIIRVRPPRTSFSLIVDPDIFILRVNLVSELRSALRIRKLKAIGVSYPARYPKEYSWSYPQVYFLLLENSSIDLKRVDFRSDSSKQLDSQEYLYHIKQTQKLHVRVIRSFLRFIASYADFSFTKHSLLTADYLLSYRAFVEVRDTGWRIWKNIERSEVEVLPNIVVDECKRILGFDEEEYVSVNDEFQSRKLNPKWHFINHGILENREIGKQVSIFRWLRPINACQYSLSATEKWPLSSVICNRELQLSDDELSLLQEFREADFYAYHEGLAVMHLGSGNKAKLGNSLERLSSALESFWKFR